MENKANRNQSMKLDEKSVLLISNDESATGEKNSLTHFSGSIPQNYLDQYLNWKVALHSFGLHLQLKQSLSPKYENFPSLIQITFKDFEALIIKHQVSDLNELSIHMFQSALKLYINRQRSYTSKSLAYDLQVQTTQNLLYKSGNLLSMPLIYQEDSNCIAFGQFEFNGNDSEERISKLPIKERKKSRTFLFLNKYFKDGMDIEFEDHGLEWNSVYIDKEIYYYFFNSRIWRSKDFYPFKSRKQNFLIESPKLVRVLSPDIKHSISNTKFNQCLREFSTKISDDGKYLHGEFKNLEYFHVLNNSINTFEVKFVDEKYKQLRLSQGLPSYTKLIFTPLMGNQENIRISSEPNDLFPNNNISNFSIELPKSLDFSWKKNTKVSLTRISLKNKWELLPGLRVDFFIYNIGEGQKQFEYFQCPRGKNGPRSCPEIVNWFKSKSKEAGTSLRLASQGNGNNSIIFNNKCIVIIGRDLAQCLGFAFVNETISNFLIRTKPPPRSSDITVLNDESDIKIAISNYSKHNSGVEIDVESFASTGDIMIVAEPNSQHHLVFPPRNIELYPNDLFIFCNIVEPTIVTGEYKQLLRIVPLSHQQQNENITIDSPNPEYHEIRTLKPKLLKFNVTTIDGKYVKSFDSSDNLYFNLQFKYE